MHPLDPHGSHVHACAFGPRQRRHDAMRDAWSSLLRRAGWTVSTEQLVHTAPHASKRADLLVTTPGGLAYALDLTFSAHLADDAPVGPHLHRIHNAKAARYGVSAAQPLPHGTTLVPITYAATRPFMHSHAVHLLYRAILAAAGSLDPPAPSARGFLLASLTAEFAATLGHCFQTWAWRMAFSCQPRCGPCRWVRVTESCLRGLGLHCSVSCVCVCLCARVCVCVCARVRTGLPANSGGRDDAPIFCGSLSSQRSRVQCRKGLRDVGRPY